jgi:hypothetical protein
MAKSFLNLSFDDRFSVYSSHNNDDSVCYLACCYFCRLFIKNDSKDIVIDLMSSHILECLWNPDRILSSEITDLISNGPVKDPLK